MEEIIKNKRYFTAQDHLDGLCDANGIAIKGGPAEPPKRDIPDSKPTQAQLDLAPGAVRKDITNPRRGGEAVDPLSLNPKKAETGLNMPEPTKD